MVVLNFALLASACFHLVVGEMHVQFSLENMIKHER